MQKKINRQQSIGIFVVSIILVSMISVNSVPSEFISFSDTSLSELQSHSTNRNNPVEVNDSVFMVKNNEVVSKNILLNDNLFDDVVLINDYVVLIKTITIHDTIFTSLAIMERIFDRQKIIKYFSDSKIYPSFNLSDLIPSLIKNDQMLISQDPFSVNINHYDLFDTFGNYVENTESLISLNNGLILFTIPVFVYIFVRTDSPKIKFSEYRKAVSYSFVFLLLSSALITPLSISENYWNDAFAEEMLLNFTSSDLNIINSTSDLSENIQNPTNVAFDIDLILENNTDLSDTFIFEQSTNTNEILDIVVEPVTNTLESTFDSF